MNDLFTAYIQSVSKKFSHKETSEMGYRTDFEILLKGTFEINKCKADRSRLEEVWYIFKKVVHTSHEEGKTLSFQKTRCTCRGCDSRRFRNVHNRTARPCAWTSSHQGGGGQGRQEEEISRSLRGSLLFPRFFEQSLIG